MKIKEYRFQEHGDYRGKLTVIENNEDIPFAIQRVYYLYDTINGFIRGQHSHKELEQILICIAGSCVIRLDDGDETAEVILNDPGKGLYIGPDIWREMKDFSDGAVLLVLASDLYDENDYIRDYNEFLRHTRGKSKNDTKC